MKKYLIILLLLSQIAYSSEYYVSLTGDDADAGTALEPWRTWDYADNQVSAGDKINICTGWYYESVAGLTANVVWTATENVTLSGLSASKIPEVSWAYRYSTVNTDSAADKIYCASANYDPVFIVSRSRLYGTRFAQLAASIADVNQFETHTWFWDGDTLYVSVKTSTSTPVEDYEWIRNKRIDNSILFLGNNDNNIKIQNLNFVGTLTASIKILDCDNVEIYNCQFLGSDSLDINLKNTDGITIDRCVFWGADYYPFILQDITNVSIKNCIFIVRGYAAGRGRAMRFFGATTENITIENCFFGAEDSNASQILYIDDTVASFGKSNIFNCIFDATGANSCYTIETGASLTGLHMDYNYYRCNDKDPFDADAPASWDINSITSQWGVNRDSLQYANFRNWKPMDDVDLTVLHSSPVINAGTAAIASTTQDFRFQDRPRMDFDIGPYEYLTFFGSIFSETLNILEED